MVSLLFFGDEPAFFGVFWFRDPFEFVFDLDAGNRGIKLVASNADILEGSFG